MKRYLIALLLVIIAAATYGYTQMNSAPEPLAVTEPLRIHQGAIIGGIDPLNPDIQQFNGIPYAKAKRWTPPEAAPQWGAEVRDAREFGPECLQPRGGMSEFINDVMKGQGLSWPKRQMARFYLNAQPAPMEREDCLFLNVRTANLNSASSRPVMVWIHGGSHQSGAGSSVFYQANGLVENGVVLVTINYRLGPLGYLAHPALTEEGSASGNYGLMDQIAALKWVRDNISQFGGDPGNVTIFGESAGAQSVSEIMAAPSADGLYHKAILQSGVSSYNSVHLRETPVENVRSAEDVGTEFLKPLLDPMLQTAPTANDLRKLSAAEIIQRAEARQDLTRYFKPVVDGDIIPVMIGQALRDGPAKRVPILAGYNANEATLFYPSMQTPSRFIPGPMTGTLEDRQAELAETFGANRAKALEALYGMNEADSWHNGATDMLGDDMFGVHARLLAKANAEADEPTWLYFFTRVPPSRNQTIGAYHAAEIPFVFNSHLSISPPSEADRKLTNAMAKYWTNFARSGNPNGDGLEQWPAYSEENDAWLELGEEVRGVLNVRQRKLDIIEELVDERIDLVKSKMGPFPEPEIDPDALLDVELSEVDAPASIATADPPPSILRLEEPSVPVTPEAVPDAVFTTQTAPPLAPLETAEPIVPDVAEDVLGPVTSPEVTEPPTIVPSEELPIVPTSTSQSLNDQ